MKQLTIIGNIGFDAIVKEINGNKFIEFSVAVNEKFKKQDGTTVESADWVNCAYRNIALAPYIRKGDKILVQGNMKVNVYKAKDGTQRAGIHLNAFNVQLLGGKKDDSAASTSTGTGAPAADQQSNEPVIADDLPF